MPQTTSKPRAVGVILAVILGATACTGLGGGGTTTVVTSVVNNGGGNAAPTTSNSLATNSKTKLCNLFEGRGKEIAKAVDDFNGSITHNGWSWSEGEISEKGDKVVEVAKKALPVLKDSIASDTEKGFSDVLDEFIDAVSNYSQTIEQRGSSSDFGPTYDALTKAEKDVNNACGRS